MKILKPLILALGAAFCLAVLLFPPLRCPSAYYEQPQLVGAAAGGRFEAVQIPRFSGFYGPSLSRLKNGAVVRTEIDAGELLRELALVVVLFGAASIWLPSLLERARQESARTQSA